MIPWIQVYSNLPSHPKTAKLAEELKLSSAFTSPNIVAAGILVGIWTWAIQNAYDGDLSACSATVIADACRWKKKPEQLISALKKSGYLDNDMRLHDWDEYAVLLMDAEDNRREKTRDRVKRYREKKRNADVTPDVTECNCYSNVTDTRCNAPTIPDITRHNITNNLFSGGGGNARADACEENPVEKYMDDYDVSVDRYFAADDVKPEIAKLTQQLFSSLTNRQPTSADEAQVFKTVTKAEQGPDGTWRRWVDENDQELLIHAFRIASDSGKAGDWKYINGILRRFAQRGITTIDDAETFDVKRDLAKDGLL